MLCFVVLVERCESEERDEPCILINIAMPMECVWCVRIRSRCRISQDAPHGMIRTGMTARRGATAAAGVYMQWRCKLQLRCSSRARAQIATASNNCLTTAVHGAG